MEELILALDLGTTHWKAALFSRSGRLAALERIPAPEITVSGHPCYDAAALPDHLALLVSRLDGALRRQARAVALCGMAESGGLVRAADGRPLTEIRPWFDRRSLPVFEEAAGALGPRASVTGLPDSFKYGIYKLLAFRKEGRALEGSRLLGVIEQACAALGASPAMDPTLAARTGAWDLGRGAWDGAFLESLSLSPAAFPPVLPSGSPAGTVADARFGLPLGIPVCVCGHDHLCAAHGAGALEEGRALLSMGTAQVMITGRKTVTAADLSTGLSFGPAPGGEGFACLGSIQAAGGSLNYWKKLLFPGEGYEGLMAAAAAVPLPTGLVYLPYLGGSGAPHLNPRARACLLGLGSQTEAGDLIAAVYEGIAMETRFVLERMGRFRQLICLGGLTRHHRLIRILSSVTGAEALLPGQEEGTLWGAARLAAQRALDWQDFPILRPEKTIVPDPALAPLYDRAYRRDYLPLMEREAERGANEA